MKNSDDSMDIIDDDSMDIEVQKETKNKVDDEKIFDQIVVFIQSLQENYGQYFYEIKLYFYQTTVFMDLASWTYITFAEMKYHYLKVFRRQ